MCIIQCLKRCLYFNSQWKFDSAGRTKAMPHIKSYTRISPDGTKIPWFVLTSANLSKGAWGSTAKTGLSHFITNYEAGVVFMPKFMVNIFVKFSKKHFFMNEFSDQQGLFSYRKIRYAGRTDF